MLSIRPDGLHMGTNLFLVLFVAACKFMLNKEENREQDAWGKKENGKWKKKGRFKGGLRAAPSGMLPCDWLDSHQPGELTPLICFFSADGSGQLTD